MLLTRSLTIAEFASFLVMIPAESVSNAALKPLILILGSYKNCSKGTVNEHGTRRTECENNKAAVSNASGR